MAQASDSPQFPLDQPLHPWLTREERGTLDRAARRELRKARKLAAYPDTEGRSPRAVKIEEIVIGILGRAYKVLVREVIDVVLELIEEGA